MIRLGMLENFMTVTSKFLHFTLNCSVMYPKISSNFLKMKQSELVTKFRKIIIIIFFRHIVDTLLPILVFPQQVFPNSQKYCARTDTQIEKFYQPPPTHKKLKRVQRKNKKEVNGRKSYRRYHRCDFELPHPRVFPLFFGFLTFLATFE